MKVLIFTLLTLGFYLLFHKLGALQHMSELWRKTRRGMDAASRQRSLADRQNLLTLQQTHSRWYSMEKMLCYSGLRRWIPGLTPEWWILGNLTVGAVLFLVGMLAGGIKSSVVIVSLCGAAEWGVLKRLREKNLRRTEENLAKLLDFLGNYSITAGEITGIFGQISRYMEEPVKGALDTCCYEASTTGDAGMALLAMAERVEHPKFKELARNMEISIRYCADFSTLVNSSRRSLREYLRMTGERRGMLREASVNLALLGGMSAIVLLTVGKLTGIGAGELLTGTMPGRVGIMALILLFVWFRGRVSGLN